MARLSKITVVSSAKLNLALHITGRRPDGFHSLRTVFERISLADTLTFAPSRDNNIHITCDHPGVPTDARNLVHKVARLLQENEGVAKGARIHITKRIPVAAGLAGGSSNAAAALLGLNRLWALGLSREALVRAARGVGSDVAFFLYDTPFALGTDRGDRIRPLGVTHQFWHVLITPTRPLLTKDVYNAFAEHFLGKASLTKTASDVTMLISSLKAGDRARVQDRLFNDLEGPIVRLRPALMRLKKRLQQVTPRGVCFSGSGPSLFALTGTRAEAQKAAAIFRRVYRQVFVVHTV